MFSPPGFASCRSRTASIAALQAPVEAIIGGRMSGRVADGRADPGANTGTVTTVVYPRVAARAAAAWLGAEGAGESWWPTPTARARTIVASAVMVAARTATPRRVEGR